MKSNGMAVLLFGLSLAASCSGWSRPVDLSAPGDELGAANPKGYLEVWREVDGVGLQLSKNSYLPLRYKFSTESDKAGLLGAGFYLPMFEAKNTLIREDTMRAYLPCGKGLYLWRTASDPNKFQTPDKAWTGYATEDNFTVSRDDGWQVFYRNGRLSSIISDDGRKFVWAYDGSGGGSVMQDGKPIITMEPGLGGQIADFVFGNLSYKLEYGKRPIEEVIGGHPVLKELVPALTKLIFPDATTDTFDFGLTNERIPKLTVKDTGGGSADYTWDIASRHLVSEKSQAGEWTYQIGEITEPFGMPPISRVNYDGKTDGLSVDMRNGVYTKHNADGTITVTHVFKTPGPLYEKVQKVEKIVEGKTSTIYRATYDEKGKLIREADDQGLVTTFSYDQDGKFKGKIVTLTKDPEKLAELHRQEVALTTQISAAIEPEDKQMAIRDLAMFYIYKMKDQAKAAPLLAELDHDHIYIVQAQAIAGDDLLSPQQKADKFRTLLKEYPGNVESLRVLIAVWEKAAKAL